MRHNVIFLLLSLRVVGGQYAVGALWPASGGLGGARVGAALGPSSVAAATSPFWSYWSGTSSAALAASADAVYYFTQGGMAPIGSVVSIVPGNFSSTQGLSN